MARIWLFGLASIMLVLFISYATFNIWRHLSRLGTSLNATQSQSFDIANQFQRVFFNLNGLLLQAELKSQPKEWESFNSEWKSLNDWIAQQRSSLTSDSESLILSRIDDAFDHYLEAANRLHDAPRVNNTKPFEIFAQFEKESNHLIELGYELGKAHETTLQQFYTSTNRSIINLRVFLFAAFALLIILASGFWIVLYRDMIAPLHAKLVESRALLERQEKLASLGILSAGLAHEIRNPLTAMKARLFTLGKRLEPGTAPEQDASVISREVDRLERILKDFLEFARPSEPRLAAIHAAAFLQDVRSLLLPQLELQNIRLELEHGVDPVIQIDASQMTQVMINLIRNAAESIGSNGVVTLRARRESVLLGGKETSAAVLEVTDTGKGILPEVEKRLFDPFHTTKEGGTGLGLSIAGRIVERHGGALRYKTRPGHGTTFGVVLPATTAA